MGKSRNHRDYDEIYDERPIQKQKWYEDEATIIKHRTEKHKLLEPISIEKGGMPLDYYD